jgi:hypothetical protein
MRLLQKIMIIKIHLHYTFELILHLRVSKAVEMALIQALKFQSKRISTTLKTKTLLLFRYMHN